MNALLAFKWPFSESAVERLGWVLIHSLWQFTIVALLAGLVARTMRRHSASTRYGVFVFAMSVSVIAAVATWMLLAGDGPAIAASRVASNLEWSSGGAIDPRVDAALPARSALTTAETEVPTQAIAPSSTASETRPATSPPTPAVAQPAATWSELAESVIRPWMAWIVAAWGIGVVFCSTRPLLGWHTLRRLSRVGVSPASDEVLAAMRRVSERLGVRRSVGVLQSTVAFVPMVIGYMRPVILLPLGLVASIPSAQLEAILAHELTHVRRHDFIVNVLQTLVETLLLPSSRVVAVAANPRRARALLRRSCGDAPRQSR